MTRVNGPNGGDRMRRRGLMLNGMRCQPVSYSRKGQAIVETALLLPILMLLVMGSADLGRVFYYAIAVTNSAREAARQGTYYDPSSGSNVYDGYDSQATAATQTIQVIILYNFSPVTPLAEVVGASLIQVEASTTMQVQKQQ